MDGPEAWGANDYFFDPTTFASYTFFTQSVYIGF